MMRKPSLTKMPPSVKLNEPKLFVLTKSLTSLPDKSEKSLARGNHAYTLSFRAEIVKAMLTSNLLNSQGLCIQENRDRRKTFQKCIFHFRSTRLDTSLAQLEMWRLCSPKIVALAVTHAPVRPP